MAKMLAPKTTIWWVDSTGTFNPLIPTAAALLADIVSLKAVNISCAIATGYTLNPTDSDTGDDKTICDTANAQTRGSANYEAMLPFYLEADAVGDPASVFLKAFELFKFKGATGTLVRRVGKLSTVPAAATDLVDIFTVMSDQSRYTEGDAGGAIRFEVPFLPQGYVTTNEPLA